MIDFVGQNVPRTVQTINSNEVRTTPAWQPLPEPELISEARSANLGQVPDD